MSKASSFAMFVVGVGIGSVTTWYCIKKKYEQIAQEEIDSVKEVFSKRDTFSSNKEENTDIIKKANKAKDKPEINEYASKLQKHGYTNYSDISNNKKEEESKVVDKPYVISPDNFGEFDDYEKISLTYYEDQILADDNDDLVDDVEDIIGFESLTHFGDYEDDSVFVRNDRLKCDYEILMDHRNYSDVINRKPHQMED